MSARNPTRRPARSGESVAVADGLAEVFRIDHDSPAEIFDLLLWASGEFGWYLVSTAAIYTPFTL